MKIVVTGASGFLGRNLLDQLEKGGVQAVGVSRRRFPGMFQVNDYDDTPEGDILVHLAESNDRVQVQANASTYERRTLGLLERLQAKGFSRVIYASSALLYGDYERMPRKVGDPVYEIDAYTRTKLASERMVLANDGIVARLANLYGPGMAESNVLSTILRQVHKNGPVRVFDTAPIRDFLWVEDAARALSEMVATTAHGIFNVGSGQGVSIYQLVAEVLAAAGDVDRQIESTRADNRFSSLVLDIAQTEAVLGWRPVVALRDGIAKLVKFA